MSLVPELPAIEASDFDPDSDLGDLVAVRRISDPALLPLLTSLLESEDIPYLVQGENALQTMGISQLLRGADPANVHWMLLVPATMLARANEVLTDPPAPDDRDP